MATAMDTSRLPQSAQAGCPIRSVFLRIPNEIRGYPLTASGATNPCAIITGSSTLLSGNGDAYGAVQVSVNGALHALSFQSNAYGLLLFSPNANGNVWPFRAVNVQQDHVAVAIDSQINDFVIAGESYQAQNCWYVIPNRATQPSRENCDDALTEIQALATDNADRLVVIGSERNTGRGRLDVYVDAAGATPRRVATIAGAATGFPTSGGYANASYALATDPRTAEISAFSVGVASPARVGVFAAGANGDVAPKRVLSGSNTGLPDAVGFGASLPAAFAVDIIAYDDRGRLYVATQGPTIRIFRAGVSGNASPVAVVTDPGATTGPTAGAGVAVRTSEPQ